MSGAIHPLPPHAFMAWCLVKAQGHLYLLPLCVLHLKPFVHRLLQALHENDCDIWIEFCEWHLKMCVADKEFIE
jgi:hypothetical protein